MTSRLIGWAEAKRRVSVVPSGFAVEASGARGLADPIPLDDIAGVYRRELGAGWALRQSLAKRERHERFERPAERRRIRSCGSTTGVRRRERPRAPPAKAGTSEGRLSSAAPALWRVLNVTRYTCVEASRRSQKAADGGLLAQTSPVCRQAAQVYITSVIER